jgi:ABC-type glycerol-3-phosphate transport system substrate-binding protein
MLKEAKYEKMRKDILARILTGQFPDKRLPSIKQLADTYEVSLMTANRAVKLLEKAGIVQCRPGNVGTVIDEKQAALLCSQKDSRHIWTDINMFIEKRVKIRYLAGDYMPESQALWEELTELFKVKYPWVDIEILTSECVADDLVENRKYDILQMFGRDVSSYQRQNHLMDITDLVNTSIDQDAFSPNVLSHCNASGRFFALPGMVNTPVIYYNKEHFGENPTKLNRDWNSFLNSVKEEVAKEYYAAINMGISSALHYFVGDIHNLSQPTVDKTALRELIKILKYVTLAAPNDVATQPANVIRSFLKQDINFFCAYSAYIGEIMEKSDFDWGILPMPKNPNGTPIIETSVNGIDPASKHKKEAWLFIKFLSSQAAQDIFARDRKYTPVNNISFDGTYTAQEPSAAKILKNIIKNARPSSVSSQNLYTIYSCISPVLEDYYSSHCQAEDTVDKVLENVREMLFLECLD